MQAGCRVSCGCCDPRIFESRPVVEWWRRETCRQFACVWRHACTVLRNVFWPRLRGSFLVSGSSNAKLDENKTEKKHAPESATEWTEPREVPKWNTMSRQKDGERREKNTTKPAGGTKKIQRWKDASGKDTFARANLECTAKRPPRCAPDANGQNTAVSEMAGKTGRTVRSRARPHANRADASVPSGKESQVQAGQT